MAKLRLLLIGDAGKPLQYAIYLGRVRVARLPLSTTDREVFDSIQPLLDRIGHVPEIRIRCEECGSWQTAGSLASGLTCCGDVGEGRGEEAENICGQPKAVGENAPPREWYVVRSAFHGGGIASRHSTLGGAGRACRRARVGDCVCGCAGVVAAEEYEQLETQDRNQSWTKNPSALTRA